MKRAKKAICLLLAVCLMAGLFAGCGQSGNQGSTSGNQTQGSTGGGTTGGDAAPVKDTLVVVNNSEVQSCDPAATTAKPTMDCLQQMLEPLVRMNEAGDYEMVLAESIEQTDDLTYQVHIRQGVKFHNGEELKASDVVFTFTRAMASAKAAPNLTELDPEGIKEIDAYTVEFKTLTPVATFENVLSRNNGLILNQKAVEEAGENVGRSCIGTGPYMFVEWQAGVQITMKAFDEYWGEKAKIPNVTYKFVDDANSRVVMLEAGEADIIYSVPATGVDILTGNDKVKVMEETSNTVRWFFINTQVEPTSDINLRKAIAYALDTEALTLAVFGEHASPATSFLAPNLMGHTADLETYGRDLDKAKECLAAAGYEAGELTLTLTMWAQTVQNSMAEIIQAQLGEIGITVNIESLESAAFSAALGTGEIQLGLATNSNTSGDPGAASKVFKSTNFPKPNYSGLASDEIDKLLDEGLACTDPTEREAIYTKVQQLAAEECCIIPLCYENEIFGINANLQGFYVSKRGFQNFAEYSF